MTALLYVVLILLCPLLTLAALLHLLYLESMRLRARETRALTLFKEELEDLLGVEGETGALAASLIEHTLILTASAVLLVLVESDRTHPWQALPEGIAGAWMLVFAFGYFLPHLIYRRTSGAWLRRAVPGLRILLSATKPLTALVSFFQTVLAPEKSSSDVRNPEEESSMEQIDAFIDAGAEEGILEEDSRRLVHSAVTFSDKTVRMTMTPRPKIVAIPADATLAELRALVINQRFSRIPVYEGTVDNVVGFVHVRDLFEVTDSDLGTRRVREIMRKIMVVPETKPADDLFREMQDSRTHMAVVVDEYGNTAGLVTLEDLLEEIVGEIRDEHEPAQDVLHEADGSFVVSGSYDVDGLSELIGFRPDPGTESTTVGGLVAEWLGRVPEKGEVVEHEGVQIEVLAGDERRVDKVRIRKSNPEEKASENGGNHPR